MRNPDKTFGNEWSILELVSMGIETEDDREYFRELVNAKELSWGILLENSLKHKILPMLAYHVIDFFEAENGEVGKPIPKFVGRHLRAALEFNRHKTNLFRKAASKIVTGLSQLEIPFVATKGITFESSLYEGNGSRNLDTDIDFMIPYEFREKVSTQMENLGFISGFYHAKSNKILSHPRKEIITYNLNPDHLAPFVILTDDSLFKAVSIDFSNSFTWARSEYNLPTEEALVLRQFQAVPNSGVMLPCLSPEYTFIFTVLHLFREAWFERWIDFEQDVNLMKFGDVVRLWKTNRHIYGTREFMLLLEKYKIEKPIAWVLEHLDRTFHTNLVSSIGLANEISEEWLFSGHSSDSQPRIWSGSMRERLFYKDVRNLFS
jgi:hypothetical protein